MSDTTVAPAVTTNVPGPSAGEVSALAALIPDPGAPAPAPETSLPPVAPMQDGAIKTEPAPAEQPPPAKAEPEPQVDTEALERAEAAAKRAREGSRKYREMLEQQKKQQAEVQRAAQEAAQLRAENERIRQLEAKLKEDPYRALKDLGMTDQQLAERALREGTPEQAIHEVKALLEAERQRREALEQRIQQEREEARARQAEANFAKLADNDEKYPRLAMLNQHAQLAVARAALQQIANNGYDTNGLTDEQVAEACETFLAPKKGKAAKEAPAPAPKPAAKTLTNAVATEKATAVKDWHEMSEDEQIAQLAALLPDPT